VKETNSTAGAAGESAGDGDADARSNSKQKNYRRRSRALTVVSAAFVLLLAIGVGVAMADPQHAPNSSEIPLLVPSFSSAGQLEEMLNQGVQIDAGPTTDLVAAEELPHSDLGRNEAKELFSSVFSSVAEEAVGIFGGLEIAEFHSDHVAVVPDDESGTSAHAGNNLLESLLPLRVKNDDGQKTQVNLELEAASNELQPRNPLVEVGIPRELGEGVALPESGIDLHIVGAPESRVPSTIDDSIAFFPNIAEDTDLTVVPAPAGVETFTQLRSPKAPRTQTIHVTMPIGAELRSVEGGAEIARGEETLALIPPPTAIDAGGEPVPVTLEVNGNSVVTKAEPSEAAVYPILVDPYVETYAWSDMSNGYGDWYTASNSPNFFGSTSGIWGGQYGLNLKTTAGAVDPNAQANWNYYVPRYFSDYASLGVRPLSYIDKMTLSGVYFWFEDAAPHAPNPFAMMGIWDESKGAFATLVTRNGTEPEMVNATVTLPNYGHYTTVKNGGIALAAGGETQSRSRHLWVPQASVEVTDNDLPGFQSGTGPSKWLNGSATDPINFSVNDGGLGVYAIQAKMPKSTGGSAQLEQTVGCFGNASVPCPRTWTGGFWNFNPAAMPQGEDVVELVGKDPISHLSSARLVKVKVDHTAPGLSVSGSLTEQATVGTKLSGYSLNYGATDGDSSVAEALSPIGTQGTAEGKLERPQGIAVDSSGNIWVTDKVNQRIVEFDKDGKVLRQVGTPGSGNGQINDPRGIAVTASGDVWIAEAGNKRLQKFNSNGEFVRTISYTGGTSGTGAFQIPWGVAVSPDGTLWVADQGTHKILRFREDGTYLGGISGLPLLGPTLSGPMGIALDSFGNAWVTSNGNHKVFEFNAEGKYVFSFGAEGSGAGQFKYPSGIAVAKSGHIFVADDNNRIQAFMPDGRWLREFGAMGAGNAQLNEPRGIAVARENRVLVVDAGNHRVARWTHADQDPQSGVAKLEVKVDGIAVDSSAPGCATSNCALSREWLLKADEFSVGPHKIDVIATDGVGLPTTESLTIETHGDRTAPSVALSGPMTEQATLGTTRPSYRLQVNATDLGSAEERQSGVASTTIKVDGAVVDTASPGCSAGGCSISREWTMNAASYPVGSHNVQVIAIDAAGRSTTKSLTVNIAPDTTAPQLQATTKFYTAPEGWLEQKSYSYNASATDPNGYGIAALTLKIDGAVIRSVTQSCSAGGCSKSLGVGPINMANYKGGAHSGELIATDGAGNSAKKAWVINVDPSGVIGVGEATDTVEAVDSTTPEAVELTPVESLVGPGEGDLGEPFTLEAQAGTLQSVGTMAPSTISLSDAGAFAITTEALSETDTLYSTTLEASPVDTPAAASAPAVVEGAVAVVSNSASSVDTILRPTYDGIMAFQAIRDKTGPETYSWQVNLGADEYLKQMDPQHIGVYWGDGTLAMLISAQLAHGADGEAVETSISITGDAVVTQTVHHRVEGIVYPVVAGVGWDGGFHTSAGEVTEPSSEYPYPRDEVQEGGLVSAPVPYPAEASDIEGASASLAAPTKYMREFKRRQCEPDQIIPFLISGCSIWEEAIKSFFWYNYRQAWYPPREPQCPHDGSPGVDANDPWRCAWVGPNHQPYRDGYHITAQSLYSITYGKIAYTKQHHLTVRAFGSGHAYAHDTECICNPSVPGQEE
jgi:sugar lactone lactonase YvrE